MLSFRLVSIALVAGIQLVAAGDNQPEFAPPDILTSAGDPYTALQPYVWNLVNANNAVDGTKLIRGLITRQSGCPAGDETCSDGGCCWPGTYCVVIDGQNGCCQNGEVCDSIGGGGGECATSGYLPCTGENFCCPAGYTCYRDSANNPQCSLDSTNTLTRTSTFRIPTSTPTSTSDNSDENSDDDSSTSTPTVPKLTSTSSRSTSTSTTPRSTPTSTTPNPSPSGVISSSANGAVGWEGSSGYFGLAPFLVLIAHVL